MKMLQQWRSLNNPLDNLLKSLAIRHRSLVNVVSLAVALQPQSLRSYCEMLQSLEYLEDVELLGCKHSVVPEFLFQTQPLEQHTSSTIKKKKKKWKAAQPNYTHDPSA